MKLITAVIRKERLNYVLTELFENGIHGITVTQVQGHGGETEKVETYRGLTVKMGLTEKIRLDIGVTEPFVDKTVDVILQTARTGDVGDGKIFVLPVEKVYRIRTGEEDAEAVTPVLN
ncbi:MAG: transcriptional regulator [Trueperaceae bacterium]|nr:transcriptional regulator [Trueperaceae bacterium]MCH2666907.1 P-II family nitrogen regulator [Deinococcales bacterium]